MPNLYEGFVTKKYTPNGPREVARRKRQIGDCQLQATHDPEKVREIKPLRPPVVLSGEREDFA